jgi:hypothetical protein
MLRNRHADALADVRAEINAGAAPSPPVLSRQRRIRETFRESARNESGIS